MKRAVHILAILLWFAAFVSIGFTQDHLWITVVLFGVAIVVGAVAVRVREGRPAEHEQPPQSN